MDELQKWGEFFSRYSRFDVNKSHIDIKDFVLSVIGDTTEYTLADIGCGNGIFSFVFSLYFKHIYAIDISEAQIKALDGFLDESKIYNIEPIVGDNKDVSVKADVSFMSFSPVIQSVEDIISIEAKTNKYCVVSTVAEGSYDYHRMQLMKLLPPKIKRGFIKKAEWYLDALDSLNRKYATKREIIETKEFHRSDEFIQYFMNYFSVLGYSDTESKDIITNYINENSNNGVIEETHHYEKMVIIWNVER